MHLLRREKHRTDENKIIPKKRVINITFHTCMKQAPCHIIQIHTSAYQLKKNEFCMMMYENVRNIPRCSFIHEDDNQAITQISTLA